VSRDTYGTCYLPKGKKGEEKALIHYERILEYYYRTRTEEEFLENVTHFVNPVIGDHPIIFEVFTDTDGESGAIEIMRTFLVDRNTVIKNKIIGTIRGALGKRGIEKVKLILGK
jgi:2-succinyl-5-enolpyruvyl-6-hydroxy-3-cyclohexene-1-carboxylate synthase